MVKQIKINLDEIKNPNPAIRKKYESNSAMDLALSLNELERVEYQGERRLFMAAQAGGKGVKHRINAIYRKRVLRNEYLLFFEHLLT